MSATTRARRTAWCASAARGCSSSTEPAARGATHVNTIYGVISALAPVFFLFLAGCPCGPLPVPRRRPAACETPLIHCKLLYLLFFAITPPVSNAPPSSRRAFCPPADAVTFFALAPFSTKPGFAQPRTGFYLAR